MNPEADVEKVAEDGGEGLDAKLDTESPSKPSENPPVPNGGDAATRVQLSEKQLDGITLDELKSNWRKQDSYVSVLESRTSAYEGRSTCALR